MVIKPVKCQKNWVKKKIGFLGINFEFYTLEKKFGSIQHGI